MISDKEFQSLAEAKTKCDELGTLDCNSIIYTNQGQLSPSTFVYELRQDIKLMDSNITEADMIPDIEKTWLRNEQCFMIYGKSFHFFKTWEGDPTEAQILVNDIADTGSGALFDGNSTTFVERQGGNNDTYDIIFNEPIMIHAITLGTVTGVTKYSNICFELFNPTANDDFIQPDFTICTTEKSQYEFITLLIPSQIVKRIRYSFKNQFQYKISSFVIYHRGEYNIVKKFLQ